MTRRKSIYAMASIYIGTVIGAGFASGQEILQFFGKYGNYGILGMLISTIILGGVGAKTLARVYDLGIKDFHEFGNQHFYKKLFKGIEIILAFLLYTSFFIMLSGGGAIGEEFFALSKIWGILIMLVASFIVFVFGVQGISKANILIVPFLSLGIIIISIYVIRDNSYYFREMARQLSGGLSFKNCFKGLGRAGYGWLWSAIIYASHNSIGAIVVMTSLLPIIYDQRSAKLAGILGATALGIMGGLILLNLLILQTNLIGLEIPMLAIVYPMGSFLRKGYGLVLLLAMFTTAIANGYGAILGFSRILGWGEAWMKIIICLTALPLANMGFKNLISFFYPLFGYIGFLFIGAIFLKAKGE